PASDDLDVVYRVLLGLMRTVRRAGRVRLKLRMDVQSVNEQIGVDAAVAREVGELPFDDSLDLDYQFVLRVLHALGDADSDDVIEIDVFTRELDPHDRTSRATNRSRRAADARVLNSTLA